MKLRVPRVGFFVLAGLLSGCADSGIIDPPMATPTSVSITQSNPTLSAIGETVALEAQAFSNDNSVLSGVTFQWSAPPNGILVVDPVSGLVTALGNGTDTVTVSTGNLSDVIEITVQQVATGIRLNQIASLLWAGATTAIPTIVTDSRGVPITGLALAWTSANPAVAVVNGAGRVTATGSGSAIISAALGAIEATVPVQVTFDGPVGGPITGAVQTCGIVAGAFPCDRIDLLSYLPVSALGGNANSAVNDMWGWTDTQTGSEYALVGRIDGLSFVDITDPINPVFLGQMGQTTGSPISSWRDVKVYQNHAFIVADGAGFHGMQIFDLTQLRNFDGVPAIFSETAHYSDIASVHNIAINEATGYAYATGSQGGGETCGGGLHMIDIRNPTTPVFAGCFADPLTGRAATGYSHDVQCVVYSGPDPDHQGSELCFGFNETALSIADVTNKANPVALARATYPNVGYTHQGWLTEDQRYLFVNDELDELSGSVNFSRTLVWDVVDIDDPILVTEHFGPTPAVDHNLYIKGNFLYTANYHNGIRVLDLTDPENPVERGSFDTAPNDANVPGFNGSWTAYPFFSNGTIGVTSRREGLFLLRLN